MLMNCLHVQYLSEVFLTTCALFVHSPQIPHVPHRDDLLRIFPRSVLVFYAVWCHTIISVTSLFFHCGLFITDQRTI